MVVAVNQKPVKITNTGATAVNTALPVDGQFNKDGIQIYNTEATAILFIKSAQTLAELTASPADNTCQWVAPNTVRNFRRDPNHLFISTVLSAAGTATTYVNPDSGFPTSMS